MWSDVISFHLSFNSDGIIIPPSDDAILTSPSRLMSNVEINSEVSSASTFRDIVVPMRVYEIRLTTSINYKANLDIDEGQRRNYKRVGQICTRRLHR